MALVVQKYGGSSVSTPEKIRGVAARIARLKATGARIVIVVSAMGDTTDELVTLARAVSPHPPARELDMLLTAGERIAMSLVSMALKDQGVEAISFTGSQAGIITDETHGSARIVEIKPGRVLEELDKKRVVIIAGFQGVSRAKEITTLGRGGSDTTAVAMAAALLADRCEILTDVEGLYSADPRRIPGARRYEKLPLALVLELARGGAQVMHCRALETALHGSLALWVGHSVEEEKGTLLLPGPVDVVPALPAVVGIALKTAASAHAAGTEAPPSAAQITAVGPALGEDTTLRGAALEALEAVIPAAVSGLTTSEHSIKIDLSVADPEALSRCVAALHQRLIP